MCGNLALDLADLREGAVPSQLQFRSDQPVLGIGGVVLPESPVGSVTGSFQIAAEGTPALIAASGRLRLGFGGSCDRAGLDNLQKGFFDSVINAQPAEGDAARLTIVEQTPPARIARNGVVGTRVSNRELATAPPAPDKPGEQRITMLGAP